MTLTSSNGSGGNGRGGNGLSAGNSGGGNFAGRRLGIVVGGSLSHGVEVRLDGAGGASVEDIAVGSFVTIRGRRQRYFAVVTDLALRAADDSLRHFPPDSPDGFIAEVMAGTLAYGQLSVMPSMTAPLEDGGGLASGGRTPEAARTIPEHFAPVFAAAQADIDAVFAAGAGTRRLCAGNAAGDGDGVHTAGFAHAGGAFRGHIRGVGLRQNLSGADAAGRGGAAGRSGGAGV